MKAWILYRLELDPMENDVGSAAYWDAVGVITDEAARKKLADLNPTVDPERCWALSTWSKPIKAFKLKEVTTMSEADVVSVLSKV